MHITKHLHACPSLPDAMLCLNMQVTVPASMMPKASSTQGAAVDLLLETRLIEAAGRSHVQAFLEDAKVGLWGGYTFRPSWKTPR